MDLDNATKPELTDHAVTIGAIKNKSAARSMKKQELIDAIKAATKAETPATADTLPAPPSGDGGDTFMTNPDVAPDVIVHSGTPRTTALDAYRDATAKGGVPVGQISKLLASADPASGSKVDLSALKAMAEKHGPIATLKEPVRRTVESPYAEPARPAVDVPVSFHRATVETSEGPLKTTIVKQREPQPQDRLDVGASFRKANLADNLLPPVLPEAKRWGSGAWSKGEMRNAQARRRKRNQQRHKRTSRSAIPRASHAR